MNGFTVMRTVFAISAMALSAQAAIPVPTAPTAVWDHDFTTLTVGGATLSLNGNAVAGDGRSVTIGETKGVSVAFGSEEYCYTVVVRYSNMHAQTWNQSLLVTHDGASYSGCFLIKDGTVASAYNKTAYSDNGVTHSSAYGGIPDPPGPAYPFGNGSGTLVFEHVIPPGGVWSTDPDDDDYNGMRLYVKPDGGVWSRVWNAGWNRASGPDKLVPGVAIGGPSADGYNSYGTKAIQGMTIEYVAVYKGKYLHPDEITGYLGDRYLKISGDQNSSPVSDAWANLGWSQGLFVGEHDTNSFVNMDMGPHVHVTDSFVARARGWNIHGVYAAHLYFENDATLGATDVGYLQKFIHLAEGKTLTLDGGVWHLGGLEASGGPGSNSDGYNIRGDGSGSTLNLANGAVLNVYARDRVGDLVKVRGDGDYHLHNGYEPANGIVAALDGGLRDSSAWTGNVWLDGVPSRMLAGNKYLNFDNFGNINSKVTVRGADGYVNLIDYPNTSEAATSFQPVGEVIVEDRPDYVSYIPGGGGATITNTVGWIMYQAGSGQWAKFRKVSGTGTILNPACEGQDPNKSDPHRVVIYDASDFTGSLKLEGKLAYYFGGADGMNSRSGVIGINTNTTVSLGRDSVFYTAYNGIHLKGTLSVVSAKTFRNASVVTYAGGVLEFDADKAGDDATLTDMSAWDLRTITGDGLVRFRGTAQPFVLPADPAKSFGSTAGLRAEGGVRLQGDLTVSRALGGDFVYASGTLGFASGSQLDVSDGVPTISSGATVSAPPNSFQVIAPAEDIQKGRVKVFAGAYIPPAWIGRHIQFTSPDGSVVRGLTTVVRADGLYAITRGTVVIAR